MPEEHLAAAERPALVKQMVKLHESHVPHGATPRMYVSFLGIWRKLFEQQRAKVAERVEHLRGGLDKLNEATSEVDKLSTLTLA